VNPVVIVASCESYRTGDFIAAARAQRLPVVIATDAASPFDDIADRSLTINLDDARAGAAAIVAAVPDAAGVIAIDDQGVAVAGASAALLGLPTNPAVAIEATRNKLAMRELLLADGVKQPDFVAVADGHLHEAVLAIGTPVVVKPVSLAASRGVIRVDDPATAATTESRIRSILRDAHHPHGEPLIAERYIDGEEMVVEGLMVDGQLEVLALIDKPVPLVGPFFEETMFVSPSGHSKETTDRVIERVAEAVEAIGLVTGPVHAEVRISEDGDVYIIEVAARSIGGLCGRSLTFGLLGEPLESVIIRSALGRTARLETAAQPATGVLMIPIPGAGRLTGIEGLDQAEEIEGIDSLEITIPTGRDVVPLPEGDRYLGFVFASGMTPADVRQSLAAAAALIDPIIDGEYVTSEGQHDAADAR